MKRVITTFTDFDNREWRDRLHGGKADDKTPEDFDIDDVRIGTAVEGEHSNNPDIATEIALDHLEENPEYYDQLITSGIADEKDAVNLYDELKKDSDKEKAKIDILKNMDEEEVKELEDEEDDDNEEDELGTDKADVEDDNLIIDDYPEIQEKIVKNYESFINEKIKIKNGKNS